MTKPAFATLSSSERRDFLLAHRGFLKNVQTNLAALGIVRALSSISRTWFGHYEKAMPALVRALEAEYLRLSGNPGESSSDTLLPQRGGVPTSAEDGRLDLTSAGMARYPVGGAAGATSAAVFRTAKVRKEQREMQRGAWLRELPTGWRFPEEQGPLDGKAVAVEVYFTIHEVAQILAIDDTATYTLLRNEPGVVRLILPGRKRPKIRVPMSVVVRLINRSTVPWPHRR